jgi:hypothetical protein
VFGLISLKDCRIVWHKSVTVSLVVGLRLPLNIFRKEKNNKLRREKKLRNLENK